jgi:hypothetical protein
MAASFPVVIASNQSSLTAVVSGTVTAVVPNPTTAVVTNTVAVNLAQLNGTTVNIGQAVMATSIPVVIASNQSALTAVVSGTVTGVVSGDIASGSADSGNPVKIGAVSHTAIATTMAVADGQRVNIIADKVGKMIAVGAIRQQMFTQTATLNTAAETAVIPAFNSTTFADIYGIILANTGSTTSKVDFRSGVASTIIFTLEVPSTDTRGFMLPVDSAIPQPTANFTWTAQAAATTSINVTAFYVKNI